MGSNTLRLPFYDSASFTTKQCQRRQNTALLSLGDLGTLGLGQDALYRLRRMLARNYNDSADALSKRLRLR